MTSDDIAIIGWAQTPMVRRTDQTEAQMLMRVITDALTPLGLTRADVDFTCLGSCDYITGQAFSFVFEPRRHRGLATQTDSHVEMDGAWALYEAWLRLHEGDIEIAVVTGSGRSSTGDPALIYPMEMDPYVLAPLGADPLTFAALAGPRRDRRRHRRRAVDGRGGGASPGKGHASRNCWPATTSANRCAATTCRRSPTAPRRWCSRSGLGHGSWWSGRRTSPGSIIAANATTRRSAVSTIRPPPGGPPLEAGLGGGRPIEVAELQAAFTHEELLLRHVLGLGAEVQVNPSGGALVGEPDHGHRLVPDRLRRRPHLQRW